MGKKSSGGFLGKAIIKDRFGRGKGRITVGDGSLLHTSELDDGYDWGRLNLQSVTEESSFNDFLATAELAGTEFEAEKLNIKIVNPSTRIGILSEDEKKKIKATQEGHKECLRIPRRPHWTVQTTAEELQSQERETFLQWRRSLAQLQEVEGIILTPYEKNLEFWRQLWRVIERSDVVVQIVDARNPLLFYCEDLNTYVKEVSAEKMTVILANKSDYLIEQQRQAWADYFTSKSMRVLFFSALQESETAKDEPEDETGQTEENRDENQDKKLNSSKLLSRDELIKIFKTIHMGKKNHEGTTTVGLVGYPNVGKSSTINCLLTYKKVSVSATPGKTKHFQTLIIDEDLTLCDSPGLVTPSFVSTKAEMIVSGILSVDRMQDHVPPINLVASLIPRHIFEDTYGIILPPPSEEEDSDRPPTSEELLNAYGYMRGFMTARGLPDNPRSARYILKNFVNGKLLHCFAPPGHNQEEYHNFPARKSQHREQPAPQARIMRTGKISAESLDKAFFQHVNVRPHYKDGKKTAQNIISGSTETLSSDSVMGKPWKKHHNKKKKEKLRRVYAHLDQ